MAAGVNVAFGHDCVMDPWYALGSADMLEVAAMGLHVAQMTSLQGQRQCFDAVTVNAARILGLQDYGLAPGCRADFVLLQAGSPEEAVRLRAQRLLVVRGGAIVSRMAPAVAELSLPGRPARVDFTRQPAGAAQGPHR
jgi:cytosine deaminase